MEKALAKDFCNTFLNLKSVLVVTVFMAVIYFVGLPDPSFSASGVLLNSVTDIGRPGIEQYDGPTNTSVSTFGSTGQWQTVRMRVTAYCPCPKCCGKYSDGITACGHKICQGDVFVSADRKYPFGTQMIIAGYNNSEPVKVFDRGRVIRGNRLDVFFNSHQEAQKWGVKYIDVKIRQNTPERIFSGSGNSVNNES